LVLSSRHALNHSSSLAFIECALAEARNLSRLFK